MATLQDILTRGQQTDGIWSHFAPTLTFGTTSLAAHQADVAALPGADQAVVDAEASIDEARDLRDVKLVLIKELATRLPRLAANSIAPDDSLQDDIAQLQGIPMKSDESILDRGQRTKTLWTGVNTRRAAATPAVAALTLPKAGGGSWAVADLSAALTAVPTLEQHVKDAAAPLSEKRSLRRTLASRVDRVNKRWYAAWGAHFPESTPEHDALSQITTEGGGGDSPAKPVVTVDGIGTPTQVGHAVSAGATSYRWLLKTEEARDYTQIGEGPADFIEMNGLSNIFNFLKCIAINSAGESPESEPVQFAGGV